MQSIYLKHSKLFAKLYLYSITNKTTMNSKVDWANNKSQESESSTSAKIQLDKNKRKKRTYKVNRRKVQLEKAWKDMSPDERSNFI